MHNPKAHARQLRGLSRESTISDRRGSDRRSQKWRHVSRNHSSTSGFALADAQHELQDTVQLAIDAWVPDEETHTTATTTTTDLPSVRDGSEVLPAVDHALFRTESELGFEIHEADVRRVPKTRAVTGTYAEAGLTVVDGKVLSAESEDARADSGIVELDSSYILDMTDQDGLASLGDEASTPMSMPATEFPQTFAPEIELSSDDESLALDERKGPPIILGRKSSEFPVEVDREASPGPSQSPRASMTIVGQPSSSIEAVEPVEVAKPVNPMKPVEIALDPPKLALDPDLAKSFSLFYPSNRSHYVPIGQRPVYRPTLASQRLAEASAAACQLGLVPQTPRRGWNAREALVRAIHDLADDPGIDPASRVLTLKQLERCHDLASAWQTAFDEARGDPAVFKTFAVFEGRRVANLVADLHEGQHILLPGGVNGGGRSQVMFYVVFRQADGRFKFIICNAGRGEHHHVADRKSRGPKRHSPPFELESVLPSLLIGPAGATFFTKLIIFNRACQMKINDAIEAIYRTVVRDLQDRELSTPRDHHVERNPYAVRTTYESLRVYLELRLLPDRFVAFTRTQKNRVIQELNESVIEAKNAQPRATAVEAQALAKQLDAAENILTTMSMRTSS